LSVTKYFVKDVSRRLEIDEHLALELKRAGYSHVELTKSPVGTRVVIYAAKPGMVIGRRGQSIRDLTKILEEKFHIENPQLSVANIDVPEQDPKVVASQVAQALQRGVHFRRAAYWAIQRVMESQALGVEITIRGKLTTERSRFEKFKAGYLPRVGDPVLKSVKAAVADVQLKQGLFGINVRILPPQIDYIDKPIMKTPPPTQETATPAAPITPAAELEPATAVETAAEVSSDGAVAVVVEEKEEEETAHSEKA
jgi:small subunit ribosomal protein S3